MFDIFAQASQEISTLSLFDNWDSGATTGGAIAALLAAIWVFFKVIRAIVGTLFMICVVFLVLKVCFDIDISAWLQPLFEQVSKGM